MFKLNSDTSTRQSTVKKQSDQFEMSQRAIHEAARLVFCVYYGIPVTEIRITDSSIEVRYQSDASFGDMHTLRDAIQMIMSGAITVQTVLGEENRLFEAAVIEATQLYELVAGSLTDSSQDFDEVLSRCCKHAIAHLADPKMRVAIGSVTRILTRERSDIRDEMLERILSHTRSKFQG